MKIINKILLLMILVFTISCTENLSEDRKDYQKKWTVLIYMDADNDLDSGEDNNFNCIFADINEMEQVGSGDSMDVILMVDRVMNSSWEKPRIYHISRDENIEKVSSPVVKQFQDELNMGDENTLNDFVEYSVANYPSEKYILVFWSHGSGWYPEKSAKVKNKASMSSSRAIGYDISNGSDGLNMLELKQALTGFSFELILFDACLMGGLEVGWQLKDISKTVVFAQGEIATSGLPYHNLLGAIYDNPSIDSKQLANQIVQDYYRYVLDTAPNVGWQRGSISAIDLQILDTELVPRINDFVSELTNDLGILTNMNLIVSNCQHLTDDLQIVDLYDFAQILYDNDYSSGNLKTAAISLMNGIQKVVINEKHTIDGFSVESYKNIHGLSVYIPFVSSLSNGSFYYPVDKFFSEYQQLDFCSNTQWGEFLKARL